MIVQINNDKTCFCFSVLPINQSCYVDAVCKLKPLVDVINTIKQILLRTCDKYQERDSQIFMMTVQTAPSYTDSAFISDLYPEYHDAGIIRIIDFNSNLFEEALSLHPPSPQIINSVHLLSS